MSTRTTVDRIQGSTPPVDVPNGGTAVRLCEPEETFPCLRGVLIQAHRSNGSGLVYVGGQSVRLSTEESTGTVTLVSSVEVLL